MTAAPEQSRLRRSSQLTIQRRSQQDSPRISPRHTRPNFQLRTRRHSHPRRPLPRQCVSWAAPPRTMGGSRYSMEANGVPSATTGLAGKRRQWCAIFSDLRAGPSPSEVPISGRAPETLSPMISNAPAARRTCRRARGFSALYFTTADTTRTRESIANTRQLPSPHLR